MNDEERLRDLSPISVLNTRAATNANNTVCPTINPLKLPETYSSKQELIPEPCALVPDFDTQKGKKRGARWHSGNLLRVFHLPSLTRPIGSTHRAWVVVLGGF